MPGIDNVRGRGLFVAFDLPTPEDRAAVLRRLHAARVLVLGGGERSIRLRPALTIEEDDLALAVREIAKAVAVPRLRTRGFLRSAVTRRRDGRRRAGG